MEVAHSASLDAALKEAEKRKVPIVIALGIPDSEIGQDVRELTGKEGKIVFLSVEPQDADALECGRRYDLSKAGSAVLTDEFGNLLQSGLKGSEAIADACYAIDDLMADRYQAWSKAVQKGEALLAEGKYPEAAAVLKVFAFAAGTDLAKEGKGLFDQTARQAAAEYERLVAGAKEGKAQESQGRDLAARLADLKAFIQKWPKTPAAFSAEALSKELEAGPESSTRPTGSP